MDRYIKLLDKVNLDVVIKLGIPNSCQYTYGTNEGWSFYGIIEYQFPDSPVYDCYVEISEQEAYSIIYKQKAIIEHILMQLNNLVGEDVGKDSLFSFFKIDEIGNEEARIVAIMFAMGQDFYQQHIQLLAELPRIKYSVETLFSYKDCKSARELLYLRTWRNTCQIISKYIEYEFLHNNISNEKYKILADYFDAKILRLSPEQEAVIRGLLA